VELIARWETTDQVPRAFALYAALGQLHISSDPEGQVARLWLADPQSAIVVQTWEQAAAVREAILQEQPTAIDLPQPLILFSEAAYRSRRDAERTGEPGLAPDKAYVLAELEDHAALTRALSVAATSHLVAPPLDQLTADLQAVHANEIAASLETARAAIGASADASPDTLPKRALELAIEAGLLEAGARQQAEQQAERQAGDSG
jgi:hypothetical protein